MMIKISRKTFDNLLGGIAADIAEESTAEDIMLRITGELNIEVEPKKLLPNITQGNLAWCWNCDGESPGTGWWRVWIEIDGDVSNKLYMREGCGSDSRKVAIADAKLHAAAPEMAKLLHKIYTSVVLDNETCVEVRQVFEKAGVKDI